MAAVLGAMTIYAASSGTDVDALDCTMILAQSGSVVDVQPYRAHWEMATLLVAFIESDTFVSVTLSTASGRINSARELSVAVNGAHVPEIVVAVVFALPPVVVSTRTTVAPGACGEAASGSSRSLRRSARGGIASAYGDSDAVSAASDF